MTISSRNNPFSVTLSFCGGTGSVTGANFLLEIRPTPKNNQTTTSKPFRVLVDCGLEQGGDFADASNREAFPYVPADIDVLLVTHAHADHIGRIPKLVRDGFRGKIYSTPATRDLAEVMLPDALRIILEEARTKHMPPLYEEQDITTGFSLWHTMPYYTLTDIGSFVSVYAKDAGHILGSAMYEVNIGTHICPGIGGFINEAPGANTGKPALASMKSAQSSAEILTVAFTGDLGNSPALFLRDTDPITDADYMVMESVYGDRNHESKDDRRAKLTAVIADTASRKRTLIIPAFSLERTQDILFEINELEHAGKVPVVPVYLDSPLGSAVTAVYKKYGADFNAEAKKMLAGEQESGGLFGVAKLKSTIDTRDSEKIDHVPGPKIIIAGSGMSHGGRVTRHEKHFLPDPQTTILLVGYQSLGTVGRQLQDGVKEVFLAGERVPVRSEIKTIFGYSSHKDSDHLVEFVASVAGNERQRKLKKVFVAMGEPKSALFLAQRLRDYLGVTAVLPKKGDKVTLL